MNALKEKVQLHTIRQDFPILNRLNRGKPLVYLDSAASAQKPYAVLTAMQQFYRNDYANIHRGVYELSEQATLAYEHARHTVAQFINAPTASNIVFVKGTTEAINLVAASFGRYQFKAGDEIILSQMEHHANIVPWVRLKEEIGIEIKVISVQENGALDNAVYPTLFSARTKLVAITHASNVLGTINPIKDMINIAHQHHVPVLIDGAQGVPHFAVDVQELDCDFYAFSAHKLYGPTGIGVLYAKSTYLEGMPPYQGGGDMIEQVSFDHINYALAPQKFEAGTPAIAEAIGLTAAIEYINSIGFATIVAHEQHLLQYLQAQLQALPFIRIIGKTLPKVGVVSFVMDNVHPHDVASVLDSEGIAIRAGHHCAMPLIQRFNVPATLRASLGMYNNEDDIDRFIAALHIAKRLFS